MKIKAGFMGKAFPPYDMQVGSLSQLLVRLRLKKRTKCMSYVSNSRLSWSESGCVDIQTWPYDLPARSWMMRATSCLQENKEILLSESSPPSPSVSSVAIW